MKYFSLNYFLIAPATAQAQASDVGLSTIGDKAIWILMTILAYLIYNYAKKNNARLKETKGLIKDIDDALEMQYKEALKGNDKVKAQQLGRQYYSVKQQGGALTNYDEQALISDLNTMRVLAQRQAQ